MSYYYTYNIKTSLGNLPASLAKWFYERNERKNIVPYDNHEFFSLVRWKNIFSLTDNQTSFKRVGDKFLLEMRGDISHGQKEITKFADFIAPYVYGRKLRRCVGWYQSEENNEPINLYVTKERQYTLNELEKDVKFLAERQSKAGCLRINGYRDTGRSSNSIVSIAYGMEPLSSQVLPSDYSDLASCENMWEKLPGHRKQGDSQIAMNRAREVVFKK